LNKGDLMTIQETVIFGSETTDPETIPVVHQTCVGSQMACAPNRGLGDVAD
jgi:hypothetical protein